VAGREDPKEDHLCKKQDDQYCSLIRGVAAMADYSPSARIDFKLCRRFADQHL
jgi:hypothetical protein